MDDDFVKPQENARRWRAAAAAVCDDALVHQVTRDAIVILQHFLKAGFEFLWMDVRQKAEPTEIDAEDRTLPVAHLPSRPQNGAVAAENQRHIGRGQIG